MNLTGPRNSINPQFNPILLTFPSPLRVSLLLPPLPPPSPHLILRNLPKQAKPNQSKAQEPHTRLPRPCRTTVSGTVPKRPTVIYSLQLTRSLSPTPPNLPTKETAADPPPRPIPAPPLQLPRSQELLLNREHPLQPELLLNRYGETIETSSASIDKARHYGSMYIFMLPLYPLRLTACQIHSCISNRSTTKTLSHLSRLLPSPSRAQSHSSTPDT